MQAAFTLTRIIREDAAEAVRLYFEPLFRLLYWLRRQLFSSAENKEQGSLLRTVQTLEVRKGGVEVLDSNVKGDYILQIIREAPLLRLERAEPERLIQHFRLVAWDFSLHEYERVQALSRISEILNVDTDRLDALSSLSSIVFRQSAQKSMGPSDQRQLLLEGLERPQAPEIGREVLGRFGAYLEVAAFLAQEGYEEAAVAVVNRAFKLFRSREMINSTRGAK